ncbi:hypothetical protein GQ600_16575 [Phytophthora cactorum]|nr:hypothetical protein GQ600_16575 [Phytophthora cactorum]
MWSGGICLVVEEQGHQGDHTGAKKAGKYVYINPFEPSQCAILALTVHLFCCPECSIGGKHQLFIRSDNKNRFGRILNRITTALSEEENCILGLRKGSSSYALGQANGPLYLRTGQSPCKLKDRYIHFEEDANQLCGRMIARLPLRERAIRVLPPHFPPEVMDKMAIDYWKQIVSGYTNCPRASINHHEQYLRNTLCSNHPIFRLECLRRTSCSISIVVRLFWHWCFTGLWFKASGVPAHTA